MDIEFISSIFIFLLLVGNIYQTIPPFMNDSFSTWRRDLASPQIGAGSPYNKLRKQKHKRPRSGLLPPIHSSDLSPLAYQCTDIGAPISSDIIYDIRNGNTEEPRVPLLSDTILPKIELGFNHTCTCVTMDTTNTIGVHHLPNLNEKKRLSKLGKISHRLNRTDHEDVDFICEISNRYGGRMVCFFYCPKLLLIVLILLLAGSTVKGSEFPGRECCDSVPPPPPNYHHAISTTTSTTPAPNGNSSLVGQYGESQLNCIQAREQCLGEGRCREALGIFKKVCGPELVACSTVTQNKCRRVLRTLQSYDYLAECKCGEPHMDFACYTFRSTIFTHPCDNMNPNDKESLMVLPTCDQALKQCRGEPACLKDYVAFIKNCNTNPDGSLCETRDAEACHRYWIKIRQSHVFGCICPPEPRTQALGASIHYSSSAYGRPEDKLSVIRDLQADNVNSCLKTYNETHRNPCLTPRPKIDQANETNSTAPQSPPSDTEIEKVQQTCHSALRSCQQDDEECQPLLSDVMMWCEHTHCEPDRCRAALQNFYARVNIRRRLEVAFCVCRQNDPDGECLTAMRKLHPTCAQRQTERGEKKCHEIAQQCRRTHNCRQRLEEYERNCSADVMTGKCSGSHRGCQFAVTKILGTELHASCICKGTDFLHQRDCYTWQKLLWSNPCVIESHLALQEEIRRGENLDDIFTKAPISTTTPTPPRVPSTQDSMDNLGLYGTMVYSPNAQGPSRGGPYGGPDFNSLGPDDFGPPREREPLFDGGGGPTFGGVPQGNSGRNVDCIPGEPRCRVIPQAPWPGRNPGGLQPGGGGGLRGRNGLIIGAGGENDRAGGRGRTGLNIGVENERGERPVGAGRGRNVPNIDGGPIDESSGGRFAQGGRHRGGGFGREGAGISLGAGGRKPGPIGGGGMGGGGMGGGAGVGGLDVENPMLGRNNWRQGNHRGTGVPMTPIGGGNNRMNGRYNIGGAGVNMPPYGGMPRPDNMGPTGSRDPYYQQPPLQPKEYPPPYNSNLPPQYVPKDNLENKGYIMTTEEPITTTLPPRYCIIQGTSQENEVENFKIPEGAWKRIYKADCSSLCECPQVAPNQELAQARCHTLACIPHRGCNTTQAHYHHSSPYYNRHRGECVCYYGNFICQRPDPEELKNILGPGIYLFLGFSKNEMELLKHHTRATELEALVEIEKLLIKKYGFKCKLITKDQVGENLIVASELRLDNDEDYVSPFDKQKMEKEECTNPLRELTDKINARPRHPEISEDAYLSMFIVAELHVNMPEAHTSPAGGTRSSRTPPSWLLVLLVAVGVILMVCENNDPVGGLENLRVFASRLRKHGDFLRGSTSSAGTVTKAT